MCWTGPLNSAKQIAEEDIKVFKICKPKDDSTCSSLYQNFIYTINEVYKSNINITKGNTLMQITQGIHSYSYELKIGRSSSSSYFFVYDKKAYRIIDTFSDFPCLVMCIIPKDSTYYLNDSGEYVSDTIKILKIIPL